MDIKFNKSDVCKQMIRNNNYDLGITADCKKCWYTIICTTDGKICTDDDLAFRFENEIFDDEICFHTCANIDYGVYEKFLNKDGDVVLQSHEDDMAFLDAFEEWQGLHSYGFVCAVDDLMRQVREELSE